MEQEEGLNTGKNYKIGDYVDSLSYWSKGEGYARKPLETHGQLVIVHKTGTSSKCYRVYGVLDAKAHMDKHSEAEILSDFTPLFTKAFGFPYRVVLPEGRDVSFEVTKAFWPNNNSGEATFDLRIFYEDGRSSQTDKESLLNTLQRVSLFRIVNESTFSVQGGQPLGQTTLPTGPAAGVGTHANATQAPSVTFEGDKFVDLGDACFADLWRLVRGFFDSNVRRSHVSAVHLVALLPRLSKKFLLTKGAEEGRHTTAELIRWLESCSITIAAMWLPREIESVDGLAYPVVASQLEARCALLRSIVKGVATAASGASEANPFALPTHIPAPPGQGRGLFSGLPDGFAAHATAQGSEGDSSSANERNAASGVNARTDNIHHADGNAVPQQVSKSLYPTLFKFTPKHWQASQTAGLFFIYFFPRETGAERA